MNATRYDANKSGIMAPQRSIEKFLVRWSHRKCAAKRGDAAAYPAPAFDPANLRPIESIQAASDVRAFLTAGVPIELTRAALRRAWVTDPAIRNFIGIAENQWDFTKPDDVPGFGSLALTPDLQRLLAALMGDNLQQGALPQTEPHDAGTSEKAGRASYQQNDDTPCVAEAISEKPRR